MEPIEFDIRQRMVNRILKEYPLRCGSNFSEFLAGKRVLIDSWLGDTFPVVLREMGIADQYDKYRAVLFIE